MAKAPKVAGLETRLRKTGMNHVYHFDINDDGRMREVAVVKVIKNPDDSIQSVYYIDVMLLDQVDKGRLKTIVTGRHADKYQLWDLLSQTTLSNGKNALDYFHQLTKVVQGKGAVNTSMSGGLGSVGLQSNDVVGSEFTDVTSGSIETQAI